ncbi:signal transduction histidine kinase [Mesoflavibacter sabulilitoris]|uniref:histidine kinase n=1 Tax=Mesoflavibacter zeaxanthinifaciens subsp. sabulilitoris TaxID=1520893 RepID=A0A2T1N612_9FLAO|nr:HAMP domain-containing sensor histidine kinase [Mesoflavibacter zeaxanthinifaciens]MBB3123354.1 signal transduction histidine kinase [Mesoflavibacter zeaxanthinifaciens subsp. sabulilitoris]PSG87013.1 hypothetical protein C7H61_12955 [Mesoflavibacter zeaxanthinifaciens subsp. sabulilitoris]
MCSNFNYYYILLFWTCFSYAQNNLTYKDFNQIDLEDLNTEGPVGELMMKAHLHTNLDSTLYFISKAELLAFESKDTLLLPYINYHYGFAYFNKQDYLLSEEYLNKCIEYGYNYNLNGMLYESYNLLALINKYQTYYNTALDYFKQSLVYAPAIQDSLHLKINIAGIYLDTDNKEMAKLYLDEVIEFNANYAKQLDSYWLIYAYLNYSKLLIPYTNQLNYLLKAKTTAKRLDDKHLILQTNIQLAQFYLENKEYALALKENKQNIKTAKAYKFTDVLLRAQLIMAQINSELNNYDKTLKHLDTLMQYEYPDWMQFEINKLRYTNLYNLNHKDQAFNIAIQQISYLDSLLKVSDNKAYAEYAKKYQTEKKIKENELLKKDNQIQALTISRERTKSYLYGSLAFIVLIFSLVLLHRYINKQKVARILSVKNNVITKQNQALEIANKTKQKFFSIIAHDLINPFNAILGYTNILQNDFEILSNTEKLQIITIINNSSNQNYTLVKNLLDWARTQQDAIVLNKTDFSLKKTIIHIVENYNILSRNKEINTIIKIDENIKVYADKDGFKTIVSNIYSNAIKYSNKNSSIVILANCNQYATKITIKDEGVGMSQAQINNLFSIATTHSTKGTSNEKGTGLGLLICKELIELHCGNLIINSKHGKGTTLTVSFPNKPH